MYPITLSDAVSVLQKFELHNPTRSKENDQPNQSQHNRQKDKAQEPKGKQADEGGKEGVSLFQQDDSKSESSKQADDKIPDAEVKLLQQVIEEDDDADDNIHSLLDQTCIHEHNHDKPSEIVLTQPSKNDRIGKNWILLDN